jgi:hypothetical protein
MRMGGQGGEKLFIYSFFFPFLWNAIFFFLRKLCLDFN